MEINLKVNLSEENLKGILEAQVSSLQGNQTLVAILTEKVTTMGEEQLEVFVNEYMSNVSEALLKKLAYAYFNSPDGRYRLEDRVAKAAQVCFESKLDPAVQAHLERAYDEKAMASMSTRYLESYGSKDRFGKVVERLTEKAFLSAYYRQAEEKILKELDFRSDELIAKTVAGKLPGWISRAVKEMLRGAKLAFYAKAGVEGD